MHPARQPQRTYPLGGTAVGRRRPARRPGHRARLRLRVVRCGRRGSRPQFRRQRLPHGQEPLRPQFPLHGALPNAPGRRRPHPVAPLRRGEPQGYRPPQRPSVGAPRRLHAAGGLRHHPARGTRWGEPPRSRGRMGGIPRAQFPQPDLYLQRRVGLDALCPGVAERHHRRCLPALSGDVRLVEPWVRTKVPDREHAKVELLTDVENRSDKACEGVLRGEIRPGGIAFSTPSASKRASGGRSGSRSARFPAWP